MSTQYRPVRLYQLTDGTFRVKVHGTTLETAEDLSQLPQIDAPAGAPSFPWTTFTPTGSWTVNSTYTGSYIQIGKLLHVRVKLALTGAPNLVNLATDLPPGFTIDPTHYVDSPSGPLGQFIAFDLSVARRWQGHIDRSTPTSVLAKFWDVQGTLIRGINVDTTNPFAAASGDSYLFAYTVPVV